MSYVRVSILGSLTGGEVWSVNPVFDPTGELGDTVNQSSLDAAAAAIAALTPGTKLLAMMSPLFQITGARLEVRHDADDHLIGLSIATRATPLAGTGTVQQAPQSAFVVSLRTDTPGATGRGRMYWPAVGELPISSGRISTTAVDAALAGAKVYLTAIRDALATNFSLVGFNLAVRSRSTATTPHVVRLQGGNVFDTQRRRRDALPETYSTLAFP